MNQQQYIYLGYYHGHSIAVSDETYEQIKALIETGKVCRECQCQYDAMNPEIARNVCLQCFLKDSNRSGLRYIGPYDYESEYSSYHYQTFMDTKGHLYKISPDLSYEQEQRDEALTMRHWGFQVPTQAIRDGEVTLLHDSEWSIYGDIHNPVIVARNHHSRIHDSKTFVFLLYKDQEPKELNKRKGETREMFKEARRRILATKDEKGHYKGLDGHEFYHEPEDYNCYDYIAQIEMERQEARKQQALQPATPPRPLRTKQQQEETQEEKKDRPIFGKSEWIRAAQGKMRPWERAIWKDVLEGEQKEHSL